ncbi:FAD-dependent oxidoreductase [Actinomycetospora sp. NBRC 106375]|uniref:NAD(P)/FAD-dependent oxidoreductase n=1 Tax=Actinomycetospora sp. NBRC 106375 TaxID=3032207 RepID=UPI0025534066|nr:FAD-dependent oxidoreductase [Actinomycetospora sp. NBRC 106375]
MAGHVIVGASLAGASAAGTLREEGYDGPVVLLGAERTVPYERPPLSKEYLMGSKELEAAYVHPPAWYVEHDIDLRLGAEVVGIDRDAGAVTLADGGTVGYDRLLLTTGASPRRLPVEGADLDGVHTLRTADDAVTLRGLLADGGRRLVVIGSGWIGLEVAAAGRTHGNEVVVVEQEDTPLKVALGAELGAAFGALHREHGVDLRLSSGVRRITGTGGHVTGVELADGSTVPADDVLVAIGAAPNVDLARTAGLAVADGIRVDAALRTADPRVFAAGDVASADHPLAGIPVRTEHWANALNGGPAAARSMLGQDVSYDRLPYFFTDQYDLGMEYSGFGALAGDARLVYRGDRDGREFVVFWVDRAGRVVAGMNVNVWDQTDAIQALVRRSFAAPVDVDRLGDPAVPLAEL